jgi:hypothetical protein
MRVTLLAVIAVVLAGCMYGPRDLDDLYVFAKHDTTGLCFFGEDWNNDNAIDSGTAGEVPCTPGVEKWIADRRRAR